MQRVNYQISLYPTHENRKSKKKTSYQWRSMESGKNEGWHEQDEGHVQKASIVLR